MDEPFLGACHPNLHRNWRGADAAGKCHSDAQNGRRTDGNIIARIDSHVYGLDRTGDGDSDCADVRADADVHAAAGGDEDADAHANPILRGGWTAAWGDVRSVESDADRDAAGDVDAITNYRPVSGESCGWGLPAVLLGD